MITPARWLTLDELPGYLKLSRSKLYRMAQERELPASKVGSQWRFDRHEIDEWMKSQGRALTTVQAMKVMMEKEVEDDAAERSLPQLQSRACKRTGAFLFHVRRGGE